MRCVCGMHSVRHVPTPRAAFVHSGGFHTGCVVHCVLVPRVGFTLGASCGVSQLPGLLDWTLTMTPVARSSVFLCKTTCLASQVTQRQLLVWKGTHVRATRACPVRGYILVRIPCETSYRSLGFRHNSICTTAAPTNHPLTPLLKLITSQRRRELFQQRKKSAMDVALLVVEKHADGLHEGVGSLHKSLTLR